jgi:hypothetical protein
MADTTLTVSLSADISGEKLAQLTRGLERDLARAGRERRTYYTSLSYSCARPEARLASGVGVWARAIRGGGTAFFAWAESGVDGCGIGVRRGTRRAGHGGCG